VRIEENALNSQPNHQRAFAALHAAAERCLDVILAARAAPHIFTDLGGSLLAVA